MKNELISRQDAIDACFNGRVANNYDCAEAIEKLPSAEKTGKWIPGKELGRTMLGDCIIEIQYDGWTCSECHCLCEDSTKPTYKFCPNCGARMEREEE